MKKYFIAISIWLGLASCHILSEDEYTHISLKSTHHLTGEVVLSSIENTNVFYDITITPNYTAFLDFHSDTILKVYSNNNWYKLVGLAIKGNGPDDLIFPFFNRYKELEDELLLIDLNTWSINNINLHIQSKQYLSINRTTISGELPPFKDANILSNYIIASDIDIQNNRLFFICNVKENKTKSISYHPDLSKKYKDESLSFLYGNNLVANKKYECICAAMKKMNLVHFYNFDGIRKKTVLIGDKLSLPKSDSKFLDFPNAPSYIIDIYATSKYIYCLYQGDKATFSKILTFDWSGNHIATFQLDKLLTKIAVSIDNTYILALSLTFEGGTDVTKYVIPLTFSDYN